MRNVTLHLFILLLACAAPARSQSILGDYLSRYNVTRLDVKAGLPKNHVTDMLMDSHGFMWVSTQGGGIVRYDGYQFGKLGDAKSESHASRVMTEDDFGRLWVAYEEHVSVYSLRTLKVVTPECAKADMKALLAEPAAFVGRDSKHHVWVVSRTKIHRLAFDKGGRVTEVASCGYTSNTPAVVVADVMADGKPWANINGGVYRLESQGGRLVPRLIDKALAPAAGIYVPAMLRRGNVVWLATSDGLLAYNPATHAMERFAHDVRANSLAHNFVTCLATDEHNRLIVGTLGGVNFYHDVTRDFETWNSRTPIQPLCSDFVNSLRVYNRQLWVGTESGGIIQLAPRQLLFSSYYHTSDSGSLAANLINSMYVEPSGRLWVGTVGSGIDVKDPGAATFRHITSANTALTHDVVSTLTGDSHGRLWIGTWNGGVCWLDMNDPMRVHPLVVDDAMKHLVANVGALAFDERNNGLWIGSNDGMFFYDCATGKLIDPFPGNRNVRGCIGSTITSDGHLWMGCIYGVRDVNLNSRHGNTFDVRALVYRLDQPESHIIEHITSIYQAADGTLWLGSNNYGLYHRTTDDDGHEHFRTLTIDDGLPNNSVKGIAEDARHRLWITTENGLAIYSPADKTFTNYSEANGLRSSEFYWNSIVGRAGKFYLGSKDGLTIVEGENRTPIYEGKLRLTDIIIDNQPVTVDGRHLEQDISVAHELRMHESERSMTISFSTLNYGNEQQGTYSYRLVGFDDEWTVLKPGEHSVRYSALPPGTYTFEVRYTSALADGKAQLATLQITVTPYFYKSWWFMLFMLAVLVTLGVWAYNRRLRALRREEAERQLAPIRQVMEESDNPQQLQERIRHILYNEQKMSASYTKSLDADKEKVTRKLGKPFIDKVMEILEQHYMDSEFGIDEFCQAIGMSRSLVNKHLNAEAGVPLGQFIRNYRLNMAREMMTKNKANRNITEIAYSVGFNDPKYFTRCFTKMYGESPSSFIVSDMLQGDGTPVTTDKQPNEG